MGKRATKVSFIAALMNWRNSAAFCSKFVKCSVSRGLSDLWVICTLEFVVQTHGSQIFADVASVSISGLSRTTGRGLGLLVCCKPVRICKVCGRSLVRLFIGEERHGKLRKANIE